MRLTTKGRFAVTAMIDLALRQNNGPVTLAAIKIGSVMLGLSPMTTVVGASIFVVVYAAIGGLKGVRFSRLTRASTLDA